MSGELTNNPFSVQSPEHIAAEDVVTLFVEDFADFHQVLRTGHTFLTWCRAESGKSMIFRFLSNQTAKFLKTRPLGELEFLPLHPDQRDRTASNRTP